jgi:Protein CHLORORESPIRATORY REDUCTION 7
VPDSIMYYEEQFVLLSPNMQQQFLNLTELTEKLRSLLTELQSDLPRDLAQISGIEAQVESLIKTACELDCSDGTWQWYAVRLEK